eukprot:102132-Prorocentrum_minimum.AAC.1
MHRRRYVLPLTVGGHGNGSVHTAGARHHHGGHGFRHHHHSYIAAPYVLPEVRLLRCPLVHPRSTECALAAMASMASARPMPSRAATASASRACRSMRPTLLGSPVRSIRLTLLGSPVRSMRPTLLGSPVRSIRPTLLGSPVRSMRPTLLGSPVRSIRPTLLGSPARTMRPTLLGSPMRSMRSTVLGSPARTMRPTLLGCPGRVPRWGPQRAAAAASHGGGALQLAWPAGGAGWRGRRVSYTFVVAVELPGARRLARLFQVRRPLPTPSRPPPVRCVAHGACSWESWVFTTLVTSVLINNLRLAVCSRH